MDFILIQETSPTKKYLMSDHLIRFWKMDLAKKLQTSFIRIIYLLMSMNVHILRYA